MRERRHAPEWLRAARAAAVLVVSATGCGPEPPARNLLLVTIDTLRADHVGAYGGRAATPALDGLAARGTLFEEAWTTVPLTTPAHASLFTGLYPWHHGIRVHGLGRLAASHGVLAEALASSGFETAAVVAAYPVSRSFGLERGFGHFDDHLGSSPDGGLRVQRPGSEVSERALAWLSGAEREPFFLWIHYFDPHRPHEAPESYRSSAASGYAAEVAFADAQLARVLEALEQGSLAERTLVVVAGDHGEGLGDHGEDEHGLLLYEETLRVPLVFAGPRVARGRRVAAPVSLVDVRPTIEALLDLAPSGLPADGIDVLGAPEQELVARSLFAETLFPRVEFGWSGLRAARRGPLKAIAAPRPELYDLAADPTERRNLAAARPEVLEALEAELAALPELEIEPAAPGASMLDKLASLGYVAGGPGGAASAGADPKDRVADHERYWQALRLDTDPDEALAMLGDLVERDPANPQFRLQLAKQLERAGRLGEAEAHARALVERYPDWPLGVQRQAEILQRLERADEAARLLEVYHAAHPEAAEAGEALALALRAAGRREEALALAVRLAAERPGEAGLHVLVGHLAGELGQLDASRAALERALSLDPGHARAALSLGRVLEAEGQAAQAFRLLEGAVRAHPRSLDLAYDACRLGQALGAPTAGDLCARARSLEAERATR